MGINERYSAEKIPEGWTRADAQGIEVNSKNENRKAKVNASLWIHNRYGFEIKQKKRNYISVTLSLNNNRKDTLVACIYLFPKCLSNKPITNG